MTNQTPTAPDVEIGGWADRAFYAALAVSTVLHVSAIAVTNTWSTSSDNSPDQGKVVDTRWSEESTDSTITPLNAVVNLPVDLREPPPAEFAAGSSTVSVEEPMQHQPQPVPPGMQPDPLADWLVERSSVGNLAEVVGPVTSGGSGSGTGSGTRPGGRFFENETEGRRFVFVVDRSKSMNYPYPGKFRTRFGRLKIEIARSIDGMTQDSEYFIIFFSDQAYPMPAADFQPASNEIRRKTFEWLADVSADGPTDPRSALQAALKMQPDVIYFLTDGDFAGTVAHDLRKLTQRKVAIHTFALGNPVGEETLKKLAKLNGGQYTFVP